MTAVTRPYNKTTWRVYDQQPGKPLVYKGYVVRGTGSKSTEIVYKGYTVKHLLVGQKHLLKQAATMVAESK